MNGSGLLLLLLLCPLLGGLPLIRWIVRTRTGQPLDRLGTGNISVSAAFYHGGKGAGILAVGSEALKGVSAVLLARYLLPGEPVWEIVALIALVIGRYSMGRGAGTTNVVWGYVVHDWAVSLLVLVISGLGFTLLRERKLGRLGVLVLIPIITGLQHPYASDRVVAATLLSLLMAWIYQKVPDDLELPTESAQGDSRQMFRFFRGDRALLSLDQPLVSAQVGAKSATLSQLRRQGYPVPPGWVLPPGDDPAPVVAALQPTGDRPLIVRSSAIGEDSETASAAGQYESIPNVTSQPALAQAIARCQLSYNRPNAIQYRQDRGSREGEMAVLIQEQIQGVFSGVAFSRDPITRQGEGVVIEALPGTASAIVSGRVTPEQYRVWVRDDLLAPATLAQQGRTGWILPDQLTLDLEGQGDVPPRLIQQVAYLARHLEASYHGIPQDMEWSYDGQQLWILQSRPITTLIPIWTRKIAAEVIPGFIRPLTWSINRPLTCGVWGDLFTIVLGARARGLDFTETATLHHSAAYFNATLLGQIFRRMGLPPESLEFLTRGAKFSKPPLRSTMGNIPGLFRLVRREMALEQDFRKDRQQYFDPDLTDLSQQPLDALTPIELLTRIDRILDLLRRATYYSILAPLSLALRRAIAKVDERELDAGDTPEVASLRSLQAIAQSCRPLLPELTLDTASPNQPNGTVLFTALANHTQGDAILQRFQQFLQEYGYLSEVGTDIAVPTWQEQPQPVQDLLAQYVFNPPPELATLPPPSRKARQLQRRLRLKGQVTDIYSRLLAHLRWSFVALEQRWIEQGWLAQKGDIFFLEIDEIRQTLTSPLPPPPETLVERVHTRQAQLERDRQALPVPALVYGNDPPRMRSPLPSNAAPVRQLRGIGASPGVVQGSILILRELQTTAVIGSDTILVVPYTDSGWSPLLARAGGIIAEVGGRLSHGAIVAREYGIPAVMDIHDATQRLQDGQRVCLDGEQGTVDVLTA